jgi:hypothetical protein
MMCCVEGLEEVCRGSCKCQQHLHRDRWAVHYRRRTGYYWSMDTRQIIVRSALHALADYQARSRQSSPYRMPGSTS